MLHSFPDDIVILGAARTPVGKFDGALREVPAHELGALVIRTALERAGVQPSQVGEVVMGQVGQVGPDAYNARRCAFAAGLPNNVTAQNVNRLCGSGLQAIWTGAHLLAVGSAAVVVAGGNESMSRMPYLDFATRREVPKLGNRSLVDGTLAMLTDPFGGYPMGVTAEHVAERCGVSRAEQDDFAVESHRRALAAAADGTFAEQIVAVPLASGSTLTADEHPRGSTVQALAQLRPVFMAEGSVTAGNSSGISDGAAAVVMTTAARARSAGLRPLLRFIDAVVVGNDPQLMGIAPVLAVQRLLQRTGVALADIDVIELNEAFAAQAVAVVRELGLDPKRVNPNGGAIAIGHPIGATGSILTVKLLYELRRTGGRLGMVTLCIGGGQGIAALFAAPDF
jgi:acetyl-CoA C-acetyltransferase